MHLMLKIMKHAKDTNTHTPPPLALTKGSLCFPGHRIYDQEETDRMYWRDNYSGMFLSSLTSTLWLTSASWSKV